MGVKYDFSGWATKNDLRCSDGRTIRRDAFKDNDGCTVPLVWNHQHNNPDNVLGHALLENRDEGVYAYCSFNDTEAGVNAKNLVLHGDVSALSIYANKLKQVGGDVVHGAIREVSLVLAGANPGAFIDSILAHGEESDSEAVIYTDESLELAHAEEEEKEDVKESEETVQDVIDTMNEKQKKVMYALIGMAMDGEEAEHSDMDEEHIEHAEDGEETVEDVFNTLNEKQKKVVYALIGMAMENGESKEEDKEMKHNVFDAETREDAAVLSHADMERIFTRGKQLGSLRDAVQEHCDTLMHAEAAEYGIEDIDILFPDAKNLNNPPEFIKRETGWVQKVMSGTHHTPFSRIKSMFADITEDEARAKGYIKGKLKKEEVFSLLKRSTTPTTIYKKQKLDRDDIIDITDFNVVAWLKSEMRMMLDEEIARAILIGDGRLASDDDHINETNIRPILNDADLFTIRWSVADGANEDEKAKNFIRACIKSRKNYKGSGRPTLFTTEDMLTDLLLLEDGIGHKLYKSEAELATALRVSEIVTVPVMEGITDKDDKDVLGIIVNLSDYNVGADNGGSVNMFDDFDIDYNQQKYLIETRCSGALIKPFSAIVLRAGDATASDEPTLQDAMKPYKPSKANA